MKQTAVVFNWIAFVWTLLGALFMLTEPPVDTMAILFLVVLLIAQVTALREMR